MLRIIGCMKATLDRWVTPEALAVLNRSIENLKVVAESETVDRENVLQSLIAMSKIL